jgi:hypothetical protein
VRIVTQRPVRDTDCADHLVQRFTPLAAALLRGITSLILGLDADQSRLSASLRPRQAGLTTMTGRQFSPGLSNHVMPRFPFRGSQSRQRLERS